MGRKWKKKEGRKWESKEKKIHGNKIVKLSKTFARQNDRRLEKIFVCCLHLAEI